jgi:rfaE bifunctional protein nucleotidyltransferase chain/domain
VELNDFESAGSPPFDVPAARHCQALARRSTLRGVNLGENIVPWEQLPAWREAFRATGRKLVVTNGCFDLLHLGHVLYLAAARQQGDALLVGLNSDNSVRLLKGPDRPVNPEGDRAGVVAALRSVDAVCIFEERSAARFLAAAEPDIYVKGGDYTLDTLNQEERRLIESAGGKIVILPLVPGRSTTTLLAKIASL